MEQVASVEPRVEDTRPLKVSYFLFQPIDVVVRGLPRVVDQAAAEKVIKIKANDFGKHPQFLIALLLIAENHPHIKSAVENTRLIETSALDFNQTRNALANEQTIDSLRELKNVALYRSLAATQKDDPSYGNNPNVYEENYNQNKISAEELTDYLIKNPVSAFHFLRNEKFQQELIQNSALIAKMIASNDSNLRQTIAKALKTDLANINPAVKQTLNLFIATLNLLNTEQMKGNPNRKGLLLRAQDIVNRADFAEQVKTFNKETTTALNEHISSMLSQLPDSAAKQSAQSKLVGIEKSQTVPGQGPYPFNLYSEVAIMKQKHDMLVTIQKWLTDPTLQRSDRFNALRPELERLDANSPLTDIGNHEREVDEDIWPKNIALNKLDRLLGDLEKIDPRAAQELKRFREDFHEGMEKSEIDNFVKGVEKTIGKINFLNQADSMLKELGRDHPQYEAFHKELQEQRENLYEELHLQNFKPSDVNARNLCNSLQKEGLHGKMSLPASPKWSKPEGESKKKVPPATRVKTIAISKENAAKLQGEKPRPKNPPPATPKGPGSH